MAIPPGLRNMRASKSWGSRRQGLFLQLQIRIPALEHGPEFLVQGFHPHLQQQMRTPLGPLQLLLRTEALADDLVDGRLDKTGADVLPIPVALAVVGDEGAIALDVSVELLYGPQELSCRAIPCWWPRLHLHYDHPEGSYPLAGPCSIGQSWWAVSPMIQLRSSSESQDRAVWPSCTWPM